MLVKAVALCLEKVHGSSSLAGSPSLSSFDGQLWDGEHFSGGKGTQIFPVLRLTLPAKACLFDGGQHQDFCCPVNGADAGRHQGLPSKPLQI